jgi:hypothetical protein
VRVGISYKSSGYQCEYDVPPLLSLLIRILHCTSKRSTFGDWHWCFGEGERNDESPRKAEFLRERADRLSRKERKTIPATNGRIGQANSTSRQKEDGRGAATRGYQACVGAMCVEGGMWHVTYVGVFPGDQRRLCGGEAHSTQTDPL